MFLQNLSILSNISRTTGRRVCRAFSDVTASSASDQKVSGFAEAFEKHSQPVVDETQVKRAPLPFSTLLKNSKFVDVSIESLARVLV